MDALEGLFLAAVIYPIAILVGVLAPTVAFLVIALVSLKGTRPADRPTILIALSALLPHRDEHAPREPRGRSRRAIRQRGSALSQGRLGKSAVLAWLYRQHEGMLDVSDYELMWPPDLFTAEARRILARPRIDVGAVDLLLREAFRDDGAAEDAAAPAYWGVSGVAERSARETLTGLAEVAHSIRRFTAPRPYWPQRQGMDAPGPHLDCAAAHKGFADLIGELEHTGYLDQAFPRPCVDDGNAPDVDPAVELEKRLGIPDLWPLAPGRWDEATFYGLIEVYHDLVARPRVRYFHDFAACGWHYSQFSVTAGCGVYRWKVNELLKSAGIRYVLASAGEDLGRLVATFDDGRSALVDSALASTRPGITDQVAHAVALFRSRAADAEYKRSAIRTLAGVLEERRQLIKTELGRPDEADLFQIANRFAIRHQRAAQQADYDPAFLDWIFWWYLATVELTNQIISRQEAAAPG
jgi:hypothetical protein